MEGAQRMFRIVAWSLVSLVLLGLAACAWAFAAGNARYQKHWQVHDVEFPIPFPLADSELTALRTERIAAGAPRTEPLSGVDLDSVALNHAVARGAHLVVSRAGCDNCHGADFGGNVVIDAPLVGFWAAPNLTTGEGGVTRGFAAKDWDHAVRHGIRHDLRTSSMPSMDFVNLSDHELSDIVAYLRSQPPVDRKLPPVRFGPVFAFVTALDKGSLPAFVINHAKPHRAEPPATAPSAEFGEHLAQTCKGCHGQHLSGGKVAGDPSMPFVANITPDESGLERWSEADFVRAMRQGLRPDGSTISQAMPWKSYGQMYDVELQALWAYLQTVPPAPKGGH